MKVDDHHNKGKLWNFVSHLHAPAPCTTCMQLPVYNIMQYSGVCSLNLFKMFLQNFIWMGFNLIDILENPTFLQPCKGTGRTNLSKQLGLDIKSNNWETNVVRYIIQRAIESLRPIACRSTCLAFDNLLWYSNCSQRQFRRR